jgi:hypothetical protein
MTREMAQEQDESDGECVSPFAPPVMQFHYKNLHTDFLHSTAPPTPGQPDFA